MKILKERVRIKISRKLRSRAAESITETLVALLISALALTMLAGAMTTATGLITKSTAKIDQYQDAIEKVIRENDSGDGVTKGSTTVNIKETGVMAGQPALSVTIGNITYYKTEVFSKNPVTTYRIQ